MKAPQPFFDSKSSQKKREENEKQPLNTKAPWGRDTPDTMYSDIVVFFSTHFRTTVHTSAPLRNLFFTDV